MLRSHPRPTIDTGRNSPSLSDMTYDSANDLHASSPSDKHEAVGFGAGLSDPLMAQERQRMLNLADRLRSVGAQADIDIPQIVAIGSQSAGKSSLLQRISGVDFPKSNGTCTRVPSEIILQEDASGSWECTVTIRYIRDASGTLLGKPRVENFGSVIHKPSEVKDRMARAQLASLNPSRPCSDFLDGPPNPNIKSDLSFSDNCVVVQIRGPGVSNLSLCDIPGLIASVAKSGKESDIKMIEELVTSYIQNSNCLILLTVTCEADFETQGAFRLAAQHDPEGKRTLGVLTKPDRIATGDEDRWVRFVKNEEEPLDLGWFCVKQPDSRQVAAGISLEEAQANEDHFFQTTEPWSSLLFGLSSRLGTKPLVESLSRMLAELISRRLPKLREKVERMIYETKIGLKELPVPPSEDAFAEAGALLMEFSKDVDANITGSISEEGLIQNINDKQNKLKSSVLSQVPEFLPYLKDTGSQPLPAMPFLEKEGIGPTFSGITMHLDEVVMLMAKVRGRELPGYTPFNVPAKILKKAMAEWPMLAREYYDEVFEVLNGFIRSMMERHFKRYRGLHAVVRSRVQELLRKIGAETEREMDRLLLREESPFTMNSSSLSQYKDDFLGHYKHCRQKDINGIAMQHIQDYKKMESSPANLTSAQENAVSQVLSGLNTINIRDVKASDLPRLHKDPFDPALEVMAMVSAYYIVAAKRIIDNISQAVDYELVQTFSKEVYRALYETLNKGDARERCALFMQESPTIRKRRVDLRSRLERLEAAKQELTEYSPW